jgi:EAL domain-containing protein (putative c-di-GMP-specific phosphodiesterase class I)/CheY-like chemotaxis protein
VSAIRVLIADDEAAIREALADLIGSEPSLHLVGAACDADDAIRLAGMHHPDVAIVDVKMPGGGGPRAAAEIRSASPQTRVVALSAYEDRGTVLEMIRSGAVGYLVKGTPAEEILETIRRAVRGQASLSAEVAADVIHELAGQLERRGRESAHRRAQVESIVQVLGTDSLWMVFQPIVDLGTGDVLGMEALARFRVEPPRPPDAWFAEAASVGLRVDLEIAAVEAALAQLDRLPSGAYLTVNVSPQAVISGAFLEALQQMPVEKLVIEMTEHAEVTDYVSLNRRLDQLRQRGGRLAVDDAGAGFANFRHILQISPEFIKLDITLTRNIDTDRGRRALAAAIISFASEMGAAIIAEGIETRSEMDVLRSLGVTLGQGYYLGRPGSLDGVTADRPLRLSLDGDPDGQGA